MPRILFTRVHSCGANTCLLEEDKDSYFECGEKCLENTDWIKERYKPCGADCLAKPNWDRFWECEGKCVPRKTACNNECFSEDILCNGSCYEKETINPCTATGVTDTTGAVTKVIGNTEVETAQTNKEILKETAKLSGTTESRDRTSFVSNTEEGETQITSTIRASTMDLSTTEQLVQSLENSMAITETSTTSDFTQSEELTPLKTTIGDVTTEKSTTNRKTSIISSFGMTSLPGTTNTLSINSMSTITRNKASTTS